MLRTGVYELLDALLSETDRLEARDRSLLPPFYNDMRSPHIILSVPKVHGV